MVNYIADTFYQDTEFPKMKFSIGITKANFTPTKAFAEAVESKPAEVGYSPYPETAEARDWAKALNSEADLIGYHHMNESWLTSWFANALMMGFDEHDKFYVPTPSNEITAYQRGYEAGIKEASSQTENHVTHFYTNAMTQGPTPSVQTGCTVGSEYVVAVDKAPNLDEVIRKILKNGGINLA